jgi:acetyl esterase/lipase
LYFHGGAWVMGDKREQGIPMLEHLAERGYVCVSANYALSPKARWPRHVLDCKLALAWVKQHIADYGGDPGLVFLSGGSAGGHLAALLALTANDPVWQPGFEHEDTTVAACIPMYGVYDFVDPDRIGNANLTSILERRVFEQAAAEAFVAASPISRVGESAPPFFVVHGRNDVLVPVESARAFVRALRARGTGPVAYAELPLTQHAFDNFWSPRTVHFVHALEHFTARIVATRAAEREVGR